MYKYCSIRFVTYYKGFDQISNFADTYDVLISTVLIVHVSISANHT